MIDRETQILIATVLIVIPAILAAGIIASMVMEYRERKRVQRIFSKAEKDAL